MNNLILIFVGGGLGSVLRFALGDYIKSKWVVMSLPMGTLVVNVLGSFLLGVTLSWLSKSGQSQNPYLYLLAVGFCGGFTTFSTFANEGQSLLSNGQIGQALLYSSVSLFLGILAVFLGWLTIGK
jgi:CrcB protein